MPFITACPIFVSQFLVVAVPTTKNLEVLSNDPSNLFSSENCTAAEVAAMHAIEMTFFIVYYGF